MGIGILKDDNDAVFINWTTGKALPLVMKSIFADDFLDWLGEDPRKMDPKELEWEYYQFIKED